MKAFTITLFCSVLFLGGCLGSDEDAESADSNGKADVGDTFDPNVPVLDYSHLRYEADEVSGTMEETTNFGFSSKEVAPFECSYGYADFVTVSKDIKSQHRDLTWIDMSVFAAGENDDPGNGTSSRIETYVTIPQEDVPLTEGYERTLSAEVEDEVTDVAIAYAGGVLTYANSSTSPTLTGSKNETVAYRLEVNPQLTVITDLSIKQTTAKKGLFGWSDPETISDVSCSAFRINKAELIDE